MKKLSLLIVLIPFFFACNSGKQHDQKEEHEHSSSEEETTTENVTVSKPDGVHFIFPEDGAVVNNPVMVGFGISGMEVEPAGEVHQGKGHHHIVVDGSFIEEGVIIPSDSTHIHFGKGQLETTVELSQGKHTLTMQFGNGVHKSYGEKWSKTIEITVE